MRLLRAVLLASGACLVAAPRINAQCENKQLQKLSAAPNGIKSFGSEVSVDGDLMAVENGDDVSQAREVLIFQRQGNGSWIQIATVTPSDSLQPFADNNFRLSLSGSRLAVGVASKNAIYIFDKIGSAWSQTAKISSTSSPPLTTIGSCVSLDGDRLAVGSLGGTPTGSTIDSGLVVIFQKQGGQWVANTELSPTLKKPNMWFGYRAVLRGNRLVVAAPQETTGASGSSGAIYVFDAPTGIWTQTARIVATDSTAVPYFGTELALGDDLIAAGTTAGKAFVFESTGPFWVQTGKLLSNDPGASLSFGQVGFAIHGSRVIIGDSGYSTTTTSDSGAAHVFEKVGSTWIEKLAISPNDPIVAGFFARSISPSAAGVIVGAPGANGAVAGSGAVYEFSTDPNSVSYYGSGCAGTGGFVPSFNITSSFDGCVNSGSSVYLSIQSGLGGSTCLVFLGLSAQAAVLPGGCKLLLQPSPFVIPVPLGGIGPGSGQITFTGTVPVSSPLVSIFMQGFIIDPGVPQGYSATNGLRLTIQ